MSDIPTPAELVDQLYTLREMYDKAEAENKRLREALSRITAWGEFDDMEHGDVGLFAKQALGGE